ncbi:hypothetical protein JTB14_028340 [Gonioctena quinquepunctata]|nr:hypothetical protein JTB14_028340 [Gonioctena quinquepunctata]
METETEQGPSRKRLNESTERDEEVSGSEQPFSTVTSRRKSKNIAKAAIAQEAPATPAAPIITAEETPAIEEDPLLEVTPLDCYRSSSAMKKSGIYTADISKPDNNLNKLALYANDTALVARSANAVQLLLGSLRQSISSPFVRLDLGVSTKLRTKEFVNNTSVLLSAIYTSERELSGDSNVLLVSLCWFFQVFVPETCFETEARPDWARQTGLRLLRKTII